MVLCSSYLLIEMKCKLTAIVQNYSGLLETDLPDTNFAMILLMPKFACILICRQLLNTNCCAVHSVSTLISPGRCPYHGKATHCILLTDVLDNRFDDRFGTAIVLGDWSL